MRCISVWNPWAALIILGFKKIETRKIPVPSTVLGERIGIACTKTIKPEQVRAYNDPFFRQAFDLTGVDDLEELPRGMLLGTVEVVKSEPITETLIKGLGRAERRFGWYEEGRHAWHLRTPQVLSHPIPVRGLQGVWRFEESRIPGL